MVTVRDRKFLSSPCTWPAPYQQKRRIAQRAPEGLLPGSNLSQWKVGHGLRIFANLIDHGIRHDASISCVSPKK
jgi:hypothetical protein